MQPVFSSLTSTVNVSPADTVTFEGVIVVEAAYEVQAGLREIGR